MRKSNVLGLVSLIMLLFSVSAVSAEIFVGDTGISDLFMFDNIRVTFPGSFASLNSHINSCDDCTIFVTPGTYTVSSTLELNNDTRIIGFGSPTLRAANGLDDEIILGRWVENVTLQGLKIDGNAAGQSVEKEGVVRFDGAKNILLTGNTFTDSYGDLVRVWAAGYGVYDNERIADVIITDNIFDTSSGSTFGKCLGVQHGSGWTISNNVLTNCVRQGFHAGDADHFIFDSNILYNNDDENIFINYDSNDGVVSNNNVRGYATEGSILIYQAARILIEGNTIQQGNRGIGINASARNITIKNNILYNITRQGIGDDCTTGQAAEGIFIDGNQLLNVGWGVARPGICLMGGENTVITNNYISDVSNSMQDCIKTDYDNAMITNNYCEGGTGGITVYGDDVVLNGNILNDVSNFGAPRIGFRLFGDDAVLTGNSCVNTEYCLNGTGLTATITGNNFQGTSSDFYSTAPGGYVVGN